VRITQDVAMGQDPNRERNLLHFQARLDAVLQQMADAIRFLEPLRGASDDTQALDAPASRWLP
jgi:hypothetical protein